MGRLQDKVAIITGGARGFGEAIARRFVNEGARVVISDLNVEQGEKTAAELNKHENTARFIETDVRIATHVERMVDKTMQQFGRLDVLVNNAGIRGGKALITELPDEDWDQVIATNLRGVYLLCKHVLPFLINQGGGSIVNISSVAGTVGFEKAAAYAAAKSAVIGLTKSLALDFAKHKVRTNAVCPGICDTDLIRNVLKASKEPDKLIAQYISVHPIGRLGVAEDVANAVLFLASDESSFVTGSCVMVDGGYTAK